MTTLDTKLQPAIWQKGLAALVVLASILLGLVAWFSLYNLLMVLAIELAVQGGEMTASQRAGIVRLVRVSSMLCGGAIWLVMAIASVGYHSEALGTRRSWRMLGWIIGIELVIVLLERTYVLLL